MKCCTTEKNRCHITPLPPHNDHLSTTGTFHYPQGGRCGGVRPYYDIDVLANQIVQGSAKNGFSTHKFCVFFSLVSLSCNYGNQTKKFERLRCLKADNAFHRIVGTFDETN